MTEHVSITQPRKQSSEQEYVLLYSWKNDRLTFEESATTVTNINPNTTTTTITTTTTVDGTGIASRAVTSREQWNTSPTAHPRCTPSGLIMMYDRSMLIVGLSVAELDAET